MSLSQRIAALSLPLLLVACGGRIEDLAEQDAQELVDTVNDSASFVPEMTAEIEAAQIAAIAAPDADLIASELASRVEANHACATAAAAANVVTIDWACTIGEGDQATDLAGQTTITVSVDGDTVTYAGQTADLAVGALDVTSATTLVVDRGDTTASITRDVTITKGSDTLTISLDGTADLVVNGDVRTLTIDATRNVQFNNFTRTHVWTGVTFQEGVRLPVAGTIDVDGARGGSLNAIFETDAAGLTTLTLTVENRRGAERVFVFTVDTANGDVVVPE